MAVRNRILLDGRAGYTEVDGIFTGATRPGSLLELTATGFRAEQTAGGQCIPVFAREQHENQGADIDDNIPASDTGTALYCSNGCIVNAVTDDTIARGQWVESAGSGKVRLFGSGQRIGQAVTASDLSGTVGRVEILVCATGS